ncbi:HupE/UreJ family protein [Phenylobacterium sp.]|uniref:HupE/UreJ family protein n=1 Tax=Phenylobacterium sp. TaxID=1871053 RepID=UPI002C2E876B|nr:HupE/UreJ family protein [Phenylobacterium sp.]HLZ75533.1 HupE/UreJ family protein [Phenylobacterium sp.]
MIPAVAQAHLVVTGMGPIYDGIDHFGLSPEDSVPVVALAFFAGLRGAATARLLLAALPLAWLAGGLIALSGVAIPAAGLSVATAVAFLAIGGLLAANVRLPPAVSAAAAIGLGLLRGFADLSGTAFSGGHLLTLAGMGASVFVVFALAASLTLPLKRFWMIIAIRVGGSWLAALGLLLAGWAWRYGARAF